MAIYKDKTSTKDGRCWYYRIRLNGKEYTSKKYKTKKECEEAQSVKLLRRDNPIKKNFDLVAQSYFDDCKKIIKEATIISHKYCYNKYIKPFFGDYDIDINLKDYKKWVDFMNEQKLSTKYKNRVRVVIVNILDYAIKNFELEKNIARNYGTFKEPANIIYYEKIRYITLEEFNKFISYVDDCLWHCFFIFLFYTGCRKSEAFALNWNDVDFDNGFININKTISRGLETELITSTKNNKNRKIKMNRTLKEEMLKYYKEMQKYADFKNNWFVFGNATIPMSRTTADRYKHYYFELSGVKEITMHEFRHSAVSLLMNELLKQDRDLDINKALYTLSARFGHSPEVMIRTYAHLYEDNIQDPIVEILDNL